MFLSDDTASMEENPAMRHALLATFEWYCDGSRPRPDVFAPDFTYTDILSAIDADFWFSSFGQPVRFLEPVLLGVIIGDGSGALLFEGVDEVRLLRTRVAWWAQGRDGRLTSLAEFRAYVDAPWPLETSVDAKAGGRRANERRERSVLGALRAVFDWWRDGSQPRPDVFAADFVFVGPTASEDAGAWFERVAREPPWVEVVQIATIAEEPSAALFFEGVETATQQRTRVAWWATGQGGRLTSLALLRARVDEGSPFAPRTAA